MPTIRDIMIPRDQLVILYPHEPVQKAHDEMDTKHIHHILVYPGDGKAVWQVYTRSDRIRFNAEGLDPTTTPVSQTATPVMYSAEPDWNCKEGYRRMNKNHIKCLLVVENGDLIGSITDTDLNEKCK